MNSGELKAIFRVVEDTSVKKVIDNVKGEVRSIGSVMEGVSKKMGADIFKNMSASFGALNAEFLKMGSVITPPKQASGAQGIQKLLQLPLLNPSYLSNPKAFQKLLDEEIKQAGGGKKVDKDFWTKILPPIAPTIIQGLRDVTGKDLSKVSSMGDFNSSGNTIKGLREVTGKDLAKISALPDINNDPNAQKAIRSKTQFYKDLTFLAQPLLNPTSIWGNMFAARQTFSAFSTEEGQRRIGGGGAAGALKATALLQGMALAVGLALKALRTAISFAADEIKKAFQFAHQLYGQSLSSGLSLKFMAQRQMTANVLGVPEAEIFRFRQSAQVMKQLSGAVGEISKDAPRLAYTAAQFKILEYNAIALGAKIGTDLAPTINKIIIALGGLVQFFEDHAKALERIFRIGVDLLTYGQYEVLRSKINSIKDNGSGTFGQPQSYLKQLPVGAFEKMGLIIGGGMGDKALEYQRRTATAVEKLVNGMTKTKNQNSFYMGRSLFVNGY